MRVILRGPPSSPGEDRLQMATVTGAYTLSPNDQGLVLQCSGGVMTLPNDLPLGFFVTIEQSTSTQVTFTPASGATLNGSNTKTAAQWSTAGLYVRDNPNGISASYVLAGDVTA